MSQSSGPLQPLSIGNVVSATIQLYRSHLKTYLGTSAIAHLWVLVPIYGWAKYAQLSGVISRHAFQELINQPESIESAKERLEPLKWSFWGVGIRVSLWLFLTYIVAAIVGGILAAILGAVLGPVGGGIGILLLFVGLLVATIRVYSRLVVAEVPLAVEAGINGPASVNRSWEITKSAIGRIQGVVFVAFLVTLPLVAVFNYLPNILQIGMDPESVMYNVLTLIGFISSLIGGALVMPFWQALKSVLYFDLRNRREGLGLKLRDR
jgi:hypothetical protein